MYGVALEMISNPYTIMVSFQHYYVKNKTTINYIQLVYVYYVGVGAFCLLR